MHWATKSVFRVDFSDSAFDEDCTSRPHNRAKTKLFFVGKDASVALSKACAWAEKHRPTWEFTGVRKARTPILYPDGRPA